MRDPEAERAATGPIPPDAVVLTFRRFGRMVAHPEEVLEVSARFGLPIWPHNGALPGQRAFEPTILRAANRTELSIGWKAIGSPGVR